MFTGKTKSGFEYEIPKSTFDNMELVDAIAESDEGNPVATSRMVNLLLGAKQRKRLYDHLRAEDGRVPVEGVIKAVNDIFTSCGQSGKNS